MDIISTNGMEDKVKALGSTIGELELLIDRVRKKKKHRATKAFSLIRRRKAPKKPPSHPKGNLKSKPPDLPTGNLRPKSPPPQRAT